MYIKCGLKTLIRKFYANWHIGCGGDRVIKLFFLTIKIRIKERIVEVLWLDYNFSYRFWAPLTYSAVLLYPLRFWAQLCQCLLRDRSCLYWFWLVCWRDEERWQNEWLLQILSSINATYGKSRLIHQKITLLVNCLVGHCLMQKETLFVSIFFATWWFSRWPGMIILRGPLVEASVPSSQEAGTFRKGRRHKRRVTQFANYGAASSAWLREEGERKQPTRSGKGGELVNGSIDGGEVES